MKIFIHSSFVFWVGKGNKNFPDGWKTLPSKTEVWAPTFAFSSKGGTKRGFLNNTTDFQPFTVAGKGGHTISSPMEAGDEIREMLQRGTASVWRRSDEYSTDFMAAASEKVRGGFFVAIRMENNGENNTASISLHNAKISTFERAVAKGKNIEILHISFSPEKSSCKYGVFSKNMLASLLTSGK